MPTIDMRPKSTASAVEVNEEVQDEEEEADDEVVEGLESLEVIGDDENDEEESTDDADDESESDEDETETTEPDANDDADTTPDEDPDEVKSFQVRIQALKDEEKRIRDGIVEARAERRKARAGDDVQEPQLVVDKTADLSDVAPADVELIERVLVSKGYVKKDELVRETYNEKLSSAKDAWLEKHPEYLPENDPEDENWNALNSTVTDFFKVPKNPADITKVLDAAHKMIRPSAAPTKLPVKTRAATDAVKEKVSVVSKGASSAGAKTAGSSRAKASSVPRSMFKGFDDDELDEMGV